MPRPRKEIPEGFPRRLSDAMRERKANQSDLETSSGVAGSTISRYISGEREPQSAQVAAIAKALGVSVDWLLFGTDRYVPVGEEDGDGFVEVIQRSAASDLDNVLDRFEWPAELEPAQAAQVETQIRSEFFKHSTGAVTVTSQSYWNTRLTRLAKEALGKVKPVRSAPTAESDADSTEESPEVRAGRKKPKRL